MTIALAWHDYPGSPNAAQALVNDLDLSVNVDSLSSRKYLGNGVVDRINNMERVSSLETIIYKISLATTVVLCGIADQFSGHYSQRKDIIHLRKVVAT